MSPCHPQDLCTDLERPGLEFGGEMGEIVQVPHKEGMERLDGEFGLQAQRSRQGSGTDVVHFFH